MKYEQVFERLWKDYAVQNPSVEKIFNLFMSREDSLVNDHVAFRTFNDPRVNISVLERIFLDLGYKACGEYSFPVKKLKAKHYELPGYPEAPRVFISELLLEEYSERLQKEVQNILNSVPGKILESPELIFARDVFGLPSRMVYDLLREESEYAAWLYAFGFRANHFTLSVNHMKSLNGIAEVNKLLKENGFSLNDSGGEIKGSRKQLLKQSSTLADIVDHPFREGVYPIPSCYYEFAERFTDNKGEIFNGFIAGSADKIFESTNFREKK